MRITRKWQLLSIGILAVVLVGFSFPQAAAHVTSSLAHNVTHIIADIAAVAAQITGVATQVTAVQGTVNNIETDVATVDTKVDGVQTTVSAIETDLEVKKKFYSEFQDKNVFALLNESVSGNFQIRIDCGDMEPKSCAFTVENILVRVTGLENDGFQKCTVFSINIDDAVNPESVVDIELFGTGTPSWDSNILLQWGIGPVASSDAVFFNYDCEAGPTNNLDANFTVQVVGEMPQGADIFVEIF